MTPGEPKGAEPAPRPSLDFSTSFPYRQHIDACLAECIGAKGVTCARLDAAPAAAEPAPGALFMHYMLGVILAADLLGVDPFDQPAVEDGKHRTRAYLQERRAVEKVS